ncbi:Protein of uncharacterised function (DUF2931) [Ewingella americana]|uniref:Protein of uncharacterized function (DUF2931) n=1 Tax=Ewingella americana TaxID=41202 RepID=A0A377TFN4_9GAMM|nr:Protein of uncharacterised function (DUF2931) [Ewingella americana]
MEITRLAASLLALTLVGCQATAGNTRPDASNPFSLPYGEWRFSFVTPQALPSLVTFASILDTTILFINSTRSMELRITQTV